MVWGLSVVWGLSRLFSGLGVIRLFSGLGVMFVFIEESVFVKGQKVGVVLIHTAAVTTFFLLVCFHGSMCLFMKSSP